MTDIYRVDGTVCTGHGSREEILGHYSNRESAEKAYLHALESHQYEWVEIVVIPIKL